MGERKHTPGPWRMTLDDFGDYTIQPENAELAIAAVVNGAFKNLVGESEEQRANAHLIAAAPDMYEALKAVSRKMDKHGDPDTGLHDMIDAALLKAEGRNG